MRSTAFGERVSWREAWHVEARERALIAKSPRCATPAVDSMRIFMHDWRVFMHATERRFFVSMSAEIHQSVSRRAAILRILRESTVRSQDELVKALRKHGFDATQSSVSRDLRELGVAKVGDHYVVPDDALAANHFEAITNFVLDARTAGPSLTVVKTTTATAQSVAVAIDKSNWPEVVGTISGDDTIFIATANERDQRRLMQRLREIFPNVNTRLAERR